MNGAPQLPLFLASAAIKPFVSNDLIVRLNFRETRRRRKARAR